MRTCIPYYKADRDSHIYRVRLSTPILQTAPSPVLRQYQTRTVLSSLAQPAPTGAAPTKRIARFE